MKRHSRLAAIVAAAIGIVCSWSVSGQRAPASGQWRHVGGDAAFTQYAPLDQINANNVKDLRVLWRRPAIPEDLQRKFPDLTGSAYLRSTPIMVDGVLYAPDAVGLVDAFDAATGRTIWRQEPYASTLEEASGVSTRGVAFWQSGSERRILVVRGAYLYSLDADTGKAVAEFGSRGRVDLARDSPLARKFFIGGSAPLVIGDLVIVAGIGGGGGDTHNTRKEAAPENVRAFDVRRGTLRWTFHVVPRPGEFGSDTWGSDSWSFSGDLGAWTPLTADEALGYVYVPLTAPSASYYGGHRPGNNLFSDSLVALDAKTGNRVWHFQAIHHDLWESDLIGAPVLGDITVEGRRVKAVMQASKNGFLYVLDRATGSPVWPIPERPVPQSTVPGEHTSATQPIPSAPPAFDRQGLTEDDLIDFTPELRAEAKKIASRYVFGPLYTPPSLVDTAPGGKQGTIALPGNYGAGNWNTGAFDPETGIYYAASHSAYVVLDLTLPTDPVRATPGPATLKYVLRKRDVPTVQGLPLVKPPYGRLTALDLKTGTKAWTIANGDGPRHHPLLEKLHLPPLGTPNRPVALVTKTLLFLGEGSDVIGGPEMYMNSWGWGRMFRAYDKASGNRIAEVKLPAGTTGGPMTYMANGKQYIVVAVGDRQAAPEFVALGLP